MDHPESFHAHVYFDANTLAQAKILCETVRDTFDISMGRMHENPVGPHPTGSCQLTVPYEKFAAVTSWLSLNRDKLAVFIHAETGDDLADHTKHVIWLGESMVLKTEMFG